MKLSIRALVITAAMLWGGSVFLVGVANVIWPTYGAGLLQLIGSFYPGYHPTGTFGSVIVATGYALVDGAIGAFMFGWLYNHLAGREDDATT